MVAVLPLSSLPLDVVVKVLCDKSLEMVSVLGLRMGSKIIHSMGDRERERERQTERERETERQRQRKSMVSVCLK